ncbi:MAG TPA: response regulator [Smithellaceae bacterium]|nr:response regulator [Smithellaceae bacterium]
MNAEIKILIVDDFASVRKIIKNQLRQFGFLNIAEAADGIAALNIIKSGEIDLIISDWNMPNMSGLELLKAVRSDETFGKIPFLMLTVESSRKNIQEAIKGGVSNYIAKPFSPETLNEKITQIMEKQGL